MDNRNSQEANELTTNALAELNGIGSPSSIDYADLENWRVKVLGRNGHIAAMLKSIALLPLDERAAAGAVANQAKHSLTTAYEAKKAELSHTTPSAKAIDVTLPGRAVQRGGLHPSTTTIRRILQVFNEMGFQTIEGPEVETEEYNFDLLNIPSDHPARDQWDTIFTNIDSPEGWLLRTHTSPMQVRAMQQTPQPIRVVVPGKCYRYESTDATHEWQFHQVEGLAVGEGITFANLKWVLTNFATRMFGAKRKVRFRCDFFPFVEPGMDMSIDCFACSNKGCALCSNTGWIEILGAGMVHPLVLRGVGYDPDVVSGFAFGMGPERIALVSRGVDDIRQFLANDLRFLTKFTNVEHMREVFL